MRKAPPGYQYSPGAIRAMSHRPVNALKECVVPGCLMPRANVYVYCQQHREAAAAWGSPTQRPVWAKDWLIEKDIVETFLTKYRKQGHGGVHCALSFFTSYARSAAAHESVPGAFEMRRRDRDTGPSEPFELLVAVASLFLYSRWRSDKLQDGVPLDYQISKSILRNPTRRNGAHKIHRYIPLPVRRAVGAYVRQELGGFLVVVCQAIEKEMEVENERKMLLMSEFEAVEAPRPPTDGEKIRTPLQAKRHQYYLNQKAKKKKKKLTLINQTKGESK